MKHIVTSNDGVQFVVDSTERSVPFDQAFAARQHSRVLASHGDFTRVDSLDALLGAEALHPAIKRITWVPAAKPARPKLTLIQGGKS